MILDVLIGIVLVLLGLILIIVFLNEIIILSNKIKNYKNWKKYKGKYVIVNISEKELYFVHRIDQNGYSSSNELEGTIKFNNQAEALVILKKYYHTNLIVLKL